MCQNTVFMKKRKYFFHSVLKQVFSQAPLLLRRISPLGQTGLTRSIRQWSLLHMACQNGAKRLWKL